MSRDPRSRLLSDVLHDDAHDAFRERLRERLLQQVTDAPAAQLELLDDVMGSSAAPNLLSAVRSRVAAESARRRRTTRIVRACAAVLVAVIGAAAFSLAKAPSPTGGSRARDDAMPVARGPASRLAMTPRRIEQVPIRALIARHAVHTSVEPSRALVMRTPRDVDARIVRTRPQPQDRLLSPAVPLDDDGLLALMRGRPCAIVTAAGGRRELRLLDPRDERAIVGLLPP